MARRCCFALFVPFASLLSRVLANHAVQIADSGHVKDAVRRNHKSPPVPLDAQDYGDVDAGGVSDFVRRELSKESIVPMRAAPSETNETQAPAESSENGEASLTSKPRKKHAQKKVASTHKAAVESQEHPSEVKTAHVTGTSTHMEPVGRKEVQRYPAQTRTAPAKAASTRMEPVERKEAQEYPTQERGAKKVKGNRSKTERAAQQQQPETEQSDPLARAIESAIASRKAKAHHSHSHAPDPPAATMGVWIAHRIAHVSLLLIFVAAVCTVGTAAHHYFGTYAMTPLKKRQRTDGQIRAEDATTARHSY